MNIFVINLDRRPDRLEHIKANLSGHKWSKVPAYDGKNKTLSDFHKEGYFPDMEWQDPLLKRPLTPTEVGCLISHYKCWQHLMNSHDDYAIVLEDDAKLERRLDVEKIKQLLSVFDIVYLGYREMDKAKDLSADLTLPSYPYLTSSYAISKQGAKKLLESDVLKSIIPADEFLALMIGYDHSTNANVNDSLRRCVQKYANVPKLSCVAFKDPFFSQISRNILGSDVESEAPLKVQYDMKVVTVGTDENKMQKLYKSAQKHNIPVINLGKGVEWRGGTMQGQGGGQKLNLVKNYISSLPNPASTIILFVDGYDVVFNEELDTIIERFVGWKCDVLFAAEKICWPDKSLAESFPDVGTEYKYLNSGLYIGFAKAIETLLETPIQDSDDDQKYLQIQYLKFLNEKQFINIVLDVENYIFQCLSAASVDVSIKQNGQLLNKATRCCPCILHGNGGPNDKKMFEKISEQLGIKTWNTGINFISTKEYKQIDTDIIECDFMTPEMCQRLIDKAEAHGKWESMYGDKFPGQELRLREFDLELFEQLEQHFKDVLNPIVEKHWWPLAMYGLRDAFIIKYDMQNQRELKCHHDASLVSGLVKLNTGYTGGETFFYRQKYSNKDIEVGKMLFWPGQVTHGHESTPLTSGTKYNLVIWTSRKKGDINYEP